jgi:drug/metabolite transporter superfamily protein YnfA
MLKGLLQPWPLPRLRRKFSQSRDNTGKPFFPYFICRKQARLQEICGVWSLQIPTKYSLHFLPAIWGAVPAVSTVLLCTLVQRAANERVTAAYSEVFPSSNVSNHSYLLTG